MGYTITEKILKDHNDDQNVAAGDFIFIDVDRCLANDITAPIAIDVFEKVIKGSNRGVFDNNKIILTPDHFTPNKDVASAEQCSILRNFARKYKIVNYFESGRVGIEHCLIPEQGLVLPGEVFIGADSHTCTYGALGAFATGVGSTDLGVAMALGKCWFKIPESIKFNYSGKLNKWVSGKDLILYTIGKIGVDGARYKAMELTGETISKLSMANRFTMCNMAIEAGAKNGIIPPDEITESYLRSIRKLTYKLYQSDSDADYVEEYEIDCNQIEPQIAFPHLPENTKPISEAHNLKIRIDQAVIGSCTNGRLEDLKIAAKIFKNQKISPEVRCIIIPGTQEIYLNAIKSGYIEIFLEAGCVVSTPTCGPCLGGHMGILGAGEKAISTTNRNFLGRMGHIDSEVYLASPAIAAASSIKGYITSPNYL
ncbi:MAG: 3-isopropylmalate dehydratase large subunit [Candidatus Lokiarchaeota archaeon]|nr:3-isopropylmalate dehydratase large subunit [Candidatus Lokiarchaeota archaeon]MBD3338609.1 3-isopropylmalate dehydratase large subunit [Candidatus Lokiarchaeota archaeon]